MLLKQVITLVAVLFLSGCAAMGVPETNDPREKLKWATELFDRQMRPLPAERLINEAISICTQNNDRECLAEAYTRYGFFFRSTAIEKWHKVYQEKGFQDKTATYDRRHLKSKEYFEKSIPIWAELERFDGLTHAYLNIAFAYEFLGDKAGACDPYTRSLEGYRKNIERNPSANVAIPKGFKDYEDYLYSQQRRAGCVK